MEVKNMKKPLRKALSLLTTLALACSMSAAALAADPESDDPSYDGWDTIKVFETTDVHGYITDISSFDEATFQYRMAYLAKIFNDARADEAYDDVLLLDGGDTFQGTPHSNLTFGAALRAAMDVMEYDAVSLGNHEFDWDVTLYGGDKDGTMAAYEIGGFKGDSDIPVLAYNMYDAGTTNRVDFVRDHAVVEKAGYTVAILGYVPDYSPDIMAAKIAPYTIDEDLTKLAGKAAQVREETEADVLVILAHGAPMDIAEAMDPEVVDLVVGGHSHKAEFGEASNGLAYIQGNSQARGYATAEIKIDPETRNVAVVDPNYVSITEKDALENLYYKDGKNELLDPTVAAIGMAAWDAVKDEMTESLGVVDTAILKEPVAEGSLNTTAGNWLTGLMLEATKDLGTVAAFTNSGGIRTELTMPEGAATRDIAVSDIYTITPFSNHILAFEITGRQMADQLELALEGSYQNSNYGDQFSGIRITYRQLADGIEVTGIVTDDGTVIDIDDTTKTYPVCVNEYNATLAGSPFEGLEPLVPYNDAPVDNLSAIAALRSISAANGGKIPVDATSHMTLDTSVPAEPTAPAEPAEPETPAEPMEPAAPIEPAVPVTPEAPSADRYTVSSGDNLWGIASRLLGDGNRWSEIYKANQDTVKDPSLIYIGQVLVIPGK